MSVFDHTPAAPGSQPIMALADITLFATFSGSDYKERTGEEVPDFDGTVPPKHWVDPAARTMNPFAVVTYTVVDNGVVTSLPMMAREAAKVNMTKQIAFPAQGQGTATEQAIAQAAGAPSRPVPIRPLGPNEKVQVGPLGGVTVVDMTSVTVPTGAGFTEGDRALLRAIATQLGVK